MLSAAEINEIVLTDQARLGPLRFSPLRNWYAVLVERLAKLEGHGSMHDLDLGLDLGGTSTVDQHDDWAWLSQLVDGVREQMLDEERTTGEERPLSECWVGRGWLTATGFGPVGLRTMLLRFVNAADAADQAVIQETWWTGPSIGWSAVPISAIVRTVDPAGLGDRVAKLLTRPATPSGPTCWLLEELIELAAVDRGRGPTPERVGGLVHLSHRVVRSASDDQILLGRLPRRLSVASRRRRRLRSRQVAVVGWRPAPSTDLASRPHARSESGPGEG
ncbi:MAG: hypothetical protein O3C27_04445 [Actinomycetota bacterium]|nr:hypothetical protein [Actinomycetota bacterium]